MSAKRAARTEAAEARALAHRAGHGAALCAALAKAVAPYQGKSIAAYMPIRSEADPWPGLAAHEGPLALPVIIAKAAPLRFRLWARGTPLVAGEYGALIPENGAFILPDVVIVPLLAFDRRGYRLGYGGGFYDRSLEELRRQKPIVALGLAYSAQERDLPLEPTDQPLDAVVTENGLRWFNAEPAR